MEIYSNRVQFLNASVNFGISVKNCTDTESRIWESGRETYKQDALTAPTTDPTVSGSVCVCKQKPQSEVYRDIVKSLEYRALCLVYKRADQKASTEVQSKTSSPFYWRFACAFSRAECIRAAHSIVYRE